MNAAARALNQGSIFRGEFSHLTINRGSLLSMSLIFVILVSAISLIYLKNYQRQLCNELQHERAQTAILQVERGQLLLEHSTLATPARVQRIASERLGMVNPTVRDVRIIN